MGKMKDALIKLAKKVSGKDLNETNKDSMSNVINFMAENYEGEGSGGGSISGLYGNEILVNLYQKLDLTVLENPEEYCAVIESSKFKTFLEKYFDLSKNPWTDPQLSETTLNVKLNSSYNDTGVVTPIEEYFEFTFNSSDPFTLVLLASNSNLSDTLSLTGDTVVTWEDIINGMPKYFPLAMYKEDSDSSVFAPFIEHFDDLLEASTSPNLSNLVVSLLGENVLVNMEDFIDLIEFKLYSDVFSA